MARCPACGAWNWFDEFKGRATCKHCGAELLHDSYGTWILGNAWKEEDDLPADRDGREYDPVAGSEQAFERLYGDRAKDTTKTQPKAERISDEEGRPAAIRTEPDTTAGTCKMCGAIIRSSSARFCSNCGASIRVGTATKTSPPAKIKVKAGKRVSVAKSGSQDCMVCNLPLNRADDVVWCPHCGRLAHRKHLMEWLRQRKQCPICGERLTEEQYK